ncbi:MAG: hypothetical protein GY944_18540, partial [bacterium]|nr:hypothetical protein [bacterium]
VVLIIRRLTNKQTDAAGETSGASASSAVAPAPDPDLERQLEKELAEF